MQQFTEIFTEAVLICLAFFLGYFAEHIRNVWTTLRPNFFSGQRWGAVMRGTFTKRTIFPLTIMLLLIVGAILINVWQTNNSIESENSRNAVLIQSVNQTITNSFNESGINETNQNMKALMDRIDKLIAIMEAQNGIYK